MTGEPLADDGTSLNICFSTTDAALSRWIRWFTAAPVSHALITFRSETLGKVMVMEAGGHGFQMIPWKKWERANTLTARFRLVSGRDAQRRALYRIADRLGDGYDGRGLFGFVPRFKDRLANKSEKPVVPLRNLLDDPRKLFCSEAVAEFLFHAGFGEFHTPCAWAPHDLYSFARSDPRLIEIPLEDNSPETLAKIARQHIAPPTGLRK